MSLSFAPSQVVVLSLMLVEILIIHVEASDHHVLTSENVKFVGFKDMVQGGVHYINIKTHHLSLHHLSSHHNKSLHIVVLHHGLLLIFCFQLLNGTIKHTIQQQVLWTCHCGCSIVVLRTTLQVTSTIWLCTLHTPVVRLSR